MRSKQNSLTLSDQNSASTAAYMYTFGSAGTWLTDAANKKALENWQIVPRMLVGATNRSLEVRFRSLRSLARSHESFTRPRSLGLSSLHRCSLRPLACKVFYTRMVNSQVHVQLAMSASPTSWVLHPLGPSRTLRQPTVQTATDGTNFTGKFILSLSLGVSRTHRENPQAPYVRNHHLLAETRESERLYGARDHARYYGPRLASSRYRNCVSPFCVRGRHPSRHV